jgi:putative transcriptional regulator
MSVAASLEGGGGSRLDAGPEGPSRRGSVLAPGVFLVASERLTDPRFAQTAVLLVEHGDQGAMGLVVNRPTDLRLAELLPEVEELEQRDDVAWVGGPVQPHRIFLLLQTGAAPEQARHIFDDVYLSASEQELRAALKREEPDERLRVYAGYAGWAPRQLEQELARGDWLVVQADARSLFREDPERLWRELMLRGSLRVAGAGRAAGPGPRRLGGLHLAQASGLYLEDEAPDPVLVRHERAGLDAPHRLSHVLVEVREGLHRERRTDAGVGEDRVLELRVPEGEHAAVRVVDEDDLPRGQHSLGDDERADHVVGDHAAGVADHVGIPLFQPQHPPGLETRVHADHRRDLLGRRHGQARLVVALGVAGVVGQQLVGCTHGSPPFGSRPAGRHSATAASGADARGATGGDAA